MTPHEASTLDRNKLLPDAFRLGRTPEAWCEELYLQKGITMSARRIRKVARETGNYLSTGKNMLLLPEHIHEILVQMSIEDQSRQSPKFIQNTGYRSATIKDDALRKLTSIASRK